jgi:hypothetical protein
MGIGTRARDNLSIADHFASIDWSTVDWIFVTVVPEGWAFEIVPGINVWDHEWITVAAEDRRPIQVEVVDPRYGQRHRLSLCSLEDPRLPVFAAGEFSNGMYAFYLPANVPPLNPVDRPAGRS